MAHAFNDWNVVPEHSVRIYEALKGRVPLQAYFHQGGHGGAPPLEMMNKWFTRYLYGVENGVEKEPKAWIVRETAAAAPPPPPPAAACRRRGRGRGRGATPPPTPYADYPNPAASAVTLRLAAGGSRARRLRSHRRRAKQGTEKLVDNVEFGGPALAAAEQSPHRLLYATPELTDAGAHLGHAARHAAARVEQAGGEPLRVARPAAVDRRADRPREPDHARLGRSAESRVAHERAATTTRRTRGAPLVPGQFYDMTFDLQPDDQIIPAGKRIGLMIFSSDRDFTLWPKPGTELTIDLDGTTLRLPVVGGTAAFAKATSR